MLSTGIIIGIVFLILVVVALTNIAVLVICATFFEDTLQKQEAAQSKNSTNGANTGKLASSGDGANVGDGTQRRQS
jgi:hypothetical protein